MTNRGRLTVTVGPMFAGKSQALANQYGELTGPECLAPPDVRVVTPTLDTRPTQRHDGGHYPASVAVAGSAGLIEAAREAEAVLIDEVQFFDTGLSQAVESLLEAGVDVYAYGLDYDVHVAAWPVTSRLKRIADEVRHLRGRCAEPRCLLPATHTGTYQPLEETPGTNPVAPGGSEAYYAACVRHWARPGLKTRYSASGAELEAERGQEG